jgi:type IV pilus assembly protein PilM
MEFLPTMMGTRPRLAVEVRAEGVVAARGDAATSLIAAVARVEMAAGALVPGLRAGNVVDRLTVVGAVRGTLEGVAAKSGERGRYVTLVIPDVAVRVLLLDFDALPAKAAEALPVVRFRLKKLLPFDVDQSVVSYQIMSSARGLVQVLAVAVPCDVLAEYEGAVTDAGYLPGAVLPSTLAALAGLEEADGPMLVVNAGPGGVTTAIVRSGVVLLHRTVDLGTEFGLAIGGVMQVPAGEHGERAEDGGDFDRMDALTRMQAGVVETELDREMQGAWMGAGMVSAADAVVAEVNRPTPVSAAREVTQAVSVAAAYFEDTLATMAGTILSAGTMGAERLGRILTESGFEGVSVREMVSPAMIEASAATAAVARGWMAGVRGALKS